jgi:hypothetical protein
MDATLILIPIAFFTVFPLFWLAVVWLISQFGWAGFATHWETREKPTGTQYELITARIGIASYRNSLLVWVNQEGLFLEPIWFFRFAHRRLFIPWEDVTSIKPTKNFWLFGCKLELKHRLSVQIYGALGKKLVEQHSIRDQ